MITVNCLFYYGQCEIYYGQYKKYFGPVIHPMSFQNVDFSSTKIRALFHVYTDTYDDDGDAILHCFMGFFLYDCTDCICIIMHQSINQIFTVAKWQQTLQGPLRSHTEGKATEGKIKQVQFKLLFKYSYR